MGYGDGSLEQFINYFARIDQFYVKCSSIVNSFIFIQLERALVKCRLAYGCY